MKTLITIYTISALLMFVVACIKSTKNRKHFHGGLLTAFIPVLNTFWAVKLLIITFKQLRSFGL
ncbi:MAG: hypothetical protein LBO09_09090 [Candidatus Peribacteria bacterium]|jgi:hypothetical protein|nr:hypothetical protein [Candidatus Peribacteria bacterium]